MDDEIKEKLKNKCVKDSTIETYLKNIYKINDNKQIKNFNFLDKINIDEKFKEYSENTRRTYLIAIVSILSCFKDDKKIKKMYDKFYDLLTIKNNSYIKEQSKHEKTETQKNNWIDYKEIETKFNELYKNIDVNNYDTLLNALILGLYVLQKPRRNKDYIEMKIIKDDERNLNTQYNYLDVKNKKFIFNNYKTNKTYNTQIIQIDDKLMKIINMYLDYWSTNDKNKNDYFLKTKKGLKFNTNTITYTLNDIFNKKIGSTMIRHIYLSHRYGNIKHMKTDSELMAHNEATQKNYVKFF